jgi:hypothetical protein
MTETLSVVTFPFVILRLADFPACPPLKFGSTILGRTPSIGRKRPNLLPKKRCECGSNKRVCELNVMFLLATKCETAEDLHQLFKLCEDRFRKQIEIVRSGNRARYARRTVMYTLQRFPDLRQLVNQACKLLVELPVFCQRLLPGIV